MEFDKILPLDGPSIDDAKEFLAKYKDEFIVIKIGGSVLNDKSLFKNLIQDICILKKIKFNPILIHGGGKELTNKLKDQNYKSEFINGLRVTDGKIIKIVEEVFINFNKLLIEEINNNSLKARTINSKENNCVIVDKINEKLGFVGKPIDIKDEMILKIIKSGEIPVIAPLGTNLKKEVFNVNADDIAAIISKKLDARRLIIISDTAVLDSNKNKISEINSKQAKDLIDKKVISEGMIPKINNCLEVVNNSQVKGVVILNGKQPRSILFELLSYEGAGTLIRK